MYLMTLFVVFITFRCLCAAGKVRIYIRCLLATLKNTIIFFVCPPKFCISIVFFFSWDPRKVPRETETLGHFQKYRNTLCLYFLLGFAMVPRENKMFMQNFGGQKVSWYF